MGPGPDFSGGPHQRVVVGQHDVHGDCEPVASPVEGCHFSLPPDFPRQPLVPPETEERVSNYLEACLAVVKADFHESLMVLKALSALRDESKGFAEQYHLAEGRSILAESAIRLFLRDILSWKLWMGPIRISVSAPSTYRVNY